MPLSPRINLIKNWILDILFPPYCVGCSSEGDFLCSTCRSSLRTVPPSCFVCKKWVPETIRVNPGRTCKSCQSLTSVYAFFSPFSFNQEVVRELVHALKYQRVRGIGKILGELLAEYCLKFNVNLPKELIIIPLPLHNWRRRRRGFNQSELIALGFISAIGTSPKSYEARPHKIFKPRVLVRAKNTTPQVELSGEERRQNIIGAFTVSDPGVVRGKHILLIDDVKTTGATLEEAARVLKEAGAKRIWVMTVAH